MDRKSPSQIRREKIIRAGAILIVLALMLSLLAGAFSAAPAQAMVLGDFDKSVQIFETDDSPVGNSMDTDNDGIPNNEDPDIDGDGVANINDEDIDGDGVANFDDGDPAATNGFDGQTPNKPGGVTFEIFEEESIWVGALIALLGLVIAGLVTSRFYKQKRAKNVQKKF